MLMMQLYILLFDTRAAVTKQLVPSVLRMLIVMLPSEADFLKKPTTQVRPGSWSSNAGTYTHTHTHVVLECYMCASTVP